MPLLDRFGPPGAREPEAVRCGWALGSTPDPAQAWPGGDGLPANAAILGL